MQIERVPGSKEITVMQDNKQTLVVTDNLVLANRSVNARLHNPGGHRGKDENGFGYPSTLKFSINEKTEDTSKIICFNLKPEDINLLYFLLMKLRKDTFEWEATRLHSFKQDANGRSPMYYFKIKRIGSVDSSGAPYRYPWTIQIQEGTAVPQQNQNGGCSAKAGSWIETGRVTKRLSDNDYIVLMNTCKRYLDLWEEAHAVPHIISGEILADMASAKSSAVDKTTSAVVLTVDRAQAILFGFASRIYETDMRTTEICKDFNELAVYYGKILDVDFSQFRLKPKGNK